MNENHDPKTGEFSSGGGGGGGPKISPADASARMSRDAYAKRLNADKSLSHADRRAALTAYDKADAQRRAGPTTTNQATHGNMDKVTQAAHGAHAHRTDLPPHMRALMHKADQYEAAQKAKFKIVDRTPKGYGPGGG